MLDAASRQRFRHSPAAGPRGVTDAKIDRMAEAVVDLFIEGVAKR